VPAVHACAALVAFAANSLLCRLALGAGTIDAATFTTIRLASGAALLFSLGGFTRRSGGPLDARRVPGTLSAPPLAGHERACGRHETPARRVEWRSAAALLVYAVAFSFAYLSLTAAAGALILFGAVQTTMLGAALWSGERPRPGEWLGLAAAAGGLIYLVSPGLTAPPCAGSALMATAGIAWGCYSLWGRRAGNPLSNTAANFATATPFAAALNLLEVGELHVTGRGALLAATSGALASGLGYVAWYAALPRLTATRAATIQLSVPVLAAAGGAIFLSEPVTPRLVFSAVLILGGIGIAIAARAGRQA
jgi:drug/metabolite transporter (DMT)-like permease